MADPEDAEGDEAERVRQDRGQDVLGLGQLLLRRARDVGNRQAQPEDRHDGPEDAVREGLDPRLSESGDGATSRAHEAYRAIVTVGYKFGLCQERPIPSSRIRRTDIVEFQSQANLARWGSLRTYFNLSPGNTDSLVANGALWQRYLTGTFLRGASLGGGRWMRHAVILLFVAVVAFSLVASVASAGRPAGLSSGTLGFTTSVLLQSNGSSEPAVAIGADGTAVFTGLSWRVVPTEVWAGPVWGTPGFPRAPGAPTRNGDRRRGAAPDRGGTGA